MGTNNNSSKCASDERYDNSKEVAELKAREDVEKRLKEVEEQRGEEKEETKRKLREEQSRKEKEEAERRIKEQEKREAEKPKRRETESEVRWNDGESQAVVETQDSKMEQLKVTIHGAKNLPKKGMLGQCNPYVVLIVEDQRIRSAAIRKSFNPGWNFTTVLDIEPGASQQLEICVFDETIDGDDLIGETCLGVDDIIMTLKVKEIKEAWLDMDYCNNAQIMISTEMVPKQSIEESSCSKPKTTTTADDETSARQLEEEEARAKQKSRKDAEKAKHAIEAEEKAREGAEKERKAEERKKRRLWSKPKKRKKED